MTTRFLPGPRAAADGVWAALTVGLLALVGRCGVDLPYMDEWPTVDALANRRPLGRWLAEWHNEHLLPAPRLLYWGLYQLGHDLRVGMLASVGMWAALARLLMSAARAARGTPAYSDAALPLLLLHAGQFENVLMSYQVCFALSALLAGGMFVATAGLPTLGRVFAVAACGAVLPLCGGHGLLFALGGWGWLAVVAGAGTFRSGGIGRTVGMLAAGGLLFGLAVGSLYGWLPGRPPPPADVPPITFGKWLAGTLGFGAAGFGPVGEKLWPVSAALPGAVGLGVAVAAWRTRRELGGPRWAGFLGSLGGLAAVAVLAAAVGWGRGRHGVGAVFFPRYVGLSALGPALALLFWVRFGPRRLSVLGPAAVAVAAALALPFNTWSGWRSGERLAVVQRCVRADLAAGVPTAVVARKYHFLTYTNPAVLAGCLERAADYGMIPGPPVPEPPTRPQPLPPPTPFGPVRSLEGGGWASTGPGGGLAFDLPAPVFAHAVVIRGTYRFPGTWPPAVATVTVLREPGGSEEVWQVPAYRYPTPDGGDPPLVVWVNGPVSGVRVTPDRAPWGFRVTGAELLVPAGP